MKRLASLDMLNRIEKEELLAGHRLQMYQLLFKEGPLSASQIFSKMPVIYKSTHVSTNRSRLTELVKMSAVSEHSKMVCPIAKRKVTAWDVTNEVPTKMSRINDDMCPYCLGKGKIKKCKPEEWHDIQN